MKKKWPPCTLLFSRRACVCRPSPQHTAPHAHTPPPPGRCRRPRARCGCDGSEKRRGVVAGARARAALPSCLASANSRSPLSLSSASCATSASCRPSRPRASTGLPPRTTSCAGTRSSSGRRTRRGMEVRRKKERERESGRGERRRRRRAARRVVLPLSLSRAHTRPHLSNDTPPSHPSQAPSS